MKLHGIAVSLLLIGFIPALPAAEPDAAKLHAWYRAEGAKVSGARVTAWENAAASGKARNLAQVVGKPRAFRVKSAAGEKTILRLDGKAALWQAAGAWGTLGDARTVLALARLAPGAEGFLFDGTTKSGQSHAQVKGGKWHVGVAGGTDSDIATHDAKTGEWQIHAFVFEKTDSGTKLTHTIAGTAPKSASVNTAPPLGGFIVGADVATKNGLECDVAEVLVHERALAGAELDAAMKDLQTRWGQPTDLPDAQQPQVAALPNDPRVFRKVIRKQGDDGVHTYRIPGLATSTKGTLLAVFDIRHKNWGDLPADIDVGLMRSTDNGATWGKMKAIMDYDASVPGSKGNGVGDPAIVVDEKTGAIFVVALWSKGARAWHGSGPGLTPEETGQFVISKSTDDGVTWTKPVSITPQVKDPAWRLCFNGPGAGIQLRDGTLVFPAQFKGADNAPHACFIASTDGGRTWKMSPAAIPEKPPTSEAQIVQLNDGALLLSMRDEGRSGQRAWARWDWKGDLMSGTWGQWWRDVPDPTCMASMLRHPSGTLLLASPGSARERVDLTIRSSKDDGKTWSDGTLLDPRPSAYSCMTVLKDGSIGILYEAGEKNYAETLTFARFPLEWVTAPGTAESVTPEGRTERTGKFGWWPQRHEEKTALSRAGGVELAFLGDSITQGWEGAGKSVWAARYANRKAANYGFGGDSTQHVLWRLDHGEWDGIAPKVCVLHIGTNNVKHSSDSPEQIAQGIRAILDRLAAKSPRTQVLLFAIFPRGADAADPWRQRCEEVNRHLGKLADGSRVHFLNINAKFLQPDGTLAKEIAPDLLHLSAQGYEIWAEAMEPKLKELLGEK